MTRKLSCIRRLAAVALAAWLAAGCAAIVGPDGTPDGEEAAAGVPSAARLAAVQTGVGYQALDQGDPSVALELFDKAHQTAPGVAAPLVGRGDALLALDRFAEAGSAYRAALARESASPAAREGLGKSLVSSGRLEEGLREFEAALAIRPSASLLNKIGVTQDMLGNGAAARKRYREALALEPKNLPARNNLALSLGISGAYDAAEKEMERVVAAPGATEQNRANLAFIYGLSGRRTDRMPAEIARAAARKGWDEAYFTRTREIARSGDRPAMLRLLSDHRPRPAAAGAAPATPARSGGAQADKQGIQELAAIPAATPKPAAPAAVRAPPAAGLSRPTVYDGGPYRMQLGAYGPDRLEGALAALTAADGLLPANRVEVVQEDGRYRLRSSEMAHLADATRICRTIRMRNIPCSVAGHAWSPAVRRFDIASAGDGHARGRFVARLPGMPAAAPSAAAPRQRNPAQTGLYRVQLAAYRLARHLTRGRTVLRRAAGDLLPPLEALVRNGGDTAVPYRLRTVPLDSRDAADRLCDRLKQRGIACLVIRHGARAWRPLA